MVRSFIHHHVSDYAAWREIYDSFGDAQREHGVRAEAVYRGVDDPNDVTVTHDFDDAEAAKAFFAIPELKEAMQRGGVEGQPAVWFAAEA
jgi:heme-degrading monooxygenase HmoA